MKFGYKWLCGSWEKTIFNFHILMTLGQGQGMTLTLNTRVVSFT